MEHNRLYIPHSSDKTCFKHKEIYKAFYFTSHIVQIKLTLKPPLIVILHLNFTYHIVQIKRSINYLYDGLKRTLHPT